MCILSDPQRLCEQETSRFAETKRQCGFSSVAITSPTVMKRGPLSSNGTSPSTNDAPTIVTLDAPSTSQERYPMCIVWTPIPLITWVLPFVGHMGICDSRGVVHDFAGPYYIGEDCLAFGNPAKYWNVADLVASSSGASAAERSPINGAVATKLAVEHKADGTTLISGEGAGSAVRAYDEAIYRQRDHFRQSQMYSFFCNNCHSYCAHCLEASGAGSGRTWNMVKLAACVFFFGKYVSVGRFLAAHLPFFIIVAIVVVVSVGTTAASK
jgi:hypothetical protein